MIDSEILKRIPQKPPFLFLEQILDKTEKSIECQKKFLDEDFFLGHFPANPIVPGVILCECCFQAGALLMSYQSNEEQNILQKTAVVSRIQQAKFKNMVKPGDQINIFVEMTDQLENACFFKAKISKGKDICLQIEFSCALVNS